MRNKETLKFITNNIKGSKKKVLILSIVQTLLGVLTVGFSFMLKPVINALSLFLLLSQLFLSSYKSFIAYITKLVISILKIDLKITYLKQSYIKIIKRLKTLMMKNGSIA